MRDSGLWPAGSTTLDGFTRENEFTSAGHASANSRVPRERLDRSNRI